MCVWGLNEKLFPPGRLDMFLTVRRLFSLLAACTCSVPLLRPSCTVVSYSASLLFFWAVWVYGFLHVIPFAYMAFSCGDKRLLLSERAGSGGHCLDYNI